MTQAYDTGVAPTRQARHPQAQNFCLLTLDGGGITVHLSNSAKFWNSLLRVVQREDLAKDPRFATYADRVVPAHYFVLADIMAKEFAKRPQREWEELLTTQDVPYAPVLTLLQYAEHPQTQWLQMLSEDPSGQKLVRPPWRFDGKRPERDRAAPHVGEHTREVLGEIRTPAQLDTLLANRTVAAPQLRRLGKNEDQTRDLRTRQVI
jgi:formyl-CoA transferase